MSVVWYTYADGIRLGPMSWDELRAAARDGSLKPDHWVWTAGYGAEWRRAATLETLFPPAKSAEESPPPPPPGPGERAGETAAPPGADGRSSARADARPGPPDAAADALRFRLRAERSPFEPPPGSPDADARRPLHCLAALGTAWYNMRLVLFVPFSFRRWLLFSVAAFLVLIGAQSELFVAPAAIGATDGAGRPAAAAAAGRNAQESKLAAFAARWQDGSAAAEAADDPAAIQAEFAEALRADCTAVRDWARRRLAGGWPALLFTGLVLIYAALRAWFLSRAWTLLVHHVYRRDEPAFLAWTDSAGPSRAVFRAVFALRVLFVALYAFVAATAVSFFAEFPAGAPLPPLSLPLASGAFTLLLLADAAAMAILRDCVVPRAMLLRTTVRGALAALRRDAGWWLLRYFGALVVVSLLFGLAVAALTGLVAAVVSVLGLSWLATFLLAALVMPLQLWRTLWSLDLLFRQHPELRAAVPPRRAEEILRRMQGGAR